MRSGRSLVLLIVILCMVWSGVRLLGSANTMTTDETLWQGRSANFYMALVKGEFEHTYQMAHPGVTVMLTGGLGVLATCPEYISSDGFYVRDLADSSASFREAGCDPHRVFIAERIAKVAFQALMIGVSLWLLSTLLPLKSVVLAGMLMAFSPWQAGLDRLLHVDGMFATASVLTLCAAAAITWRSIRISSNSWMPDALGWFGVGACVALAALTRSAGLVFLLPIGLVIVAAAIIRSQTRREAVYYAFSTGLSVVLGSVVTGFVLFPALWVDARGVATRVFGFTDSAIADGHESVLFYKGEVVSGNPGAMFYLDVWWWRSTPTEILAAVVVVTIVVCGVVRFLRDQRPEISPAWIVFSIGAALVLPYAAGITIAAKKFDRYFVLISATIAVLAAAGFTSLWQRARKSSVRKALLGVASVLVLLQGISLASSRPHMLDYFNPVPGGQVAAESRFQLGWGQGGADVTRLIIDEASKDGAQARASTQIGVFTVFVPLDSEVRFAKGPIDSVSAWYHTDFYISGLQQSQRGLDRSLHLFEGEVPVHEITIGDIVYFAIWIVNSQPVPDVLWTQNACQHIAASGVQLMGIEQQGDDVLVILRIDDSHAAHGAWVSLEAPYDSRLVVDSAEEGMLIGVVFSSMQVSEVSSIVIGGEEEAFSFDFPAGECQPAR